MTSPVLLVLVYREMAPDVWDIRRIPETRLQAFTEAGWRILIAETEIRQQMVEDLFRAEGERFNPPRMQT